MNETNITLRVNGLVTREQIEAIRGTVIMTEQGQELEVTDAYAVSLPVLQCAVPAPHKEHRYWRAPHGDDTRCPGRVKP